MTLVNRIAPPRPGAPLEIGTARTVRQKHPLRWLAATIVLVITAGLVTSMVTNDRFGWDVVGKYVFAPPILAGLLVTLELTVLSMFFGLALGWTIAVMRLSPNPVLRTAAAGYAWFFRATPLLVQLIFWYNLAALYPRLSIGIPFGAQFLPIDTNAIIGGFTAALLALSLNEAAYMSEIIRSGIQSVDEGQGEAASALGMSRRKALRLIVFPQAMRVIIPPTGNQTISMLKTTSLVSFVAVADILYASQLIYARNFETIPLLIVASSWYLLLTSILGVGQYYLERHFGRGSRRNRPLTPMQRLARQWNGLVDLLGRTSSEEQKR